jgi:hypothetical protein
MPHSTALLVPAARFCARVVSSMFASIPEEGWAERRQRTCVFVAFASAT